MRIPLYLAILALCCISKAQNVLPDWVDLSADDDRVLTLTLPAAIKSPLKQEQRDIDTLILQIDPEWETDWKQAAFQVKALIVNLKTWGGDVRVGVESPPDLVEQLLQHELAAYIDGYIFRDDPYVPDADETARLWQRVGASEHTALHVLLDAASIGVGLVLFESTPIGDNHREFLRVISETRSGSLDIQPKVQGIAQGNVHFFFDPSTGDYHLAVYADDRARNYFSFRLDHASEPELLYPDSGSFESDSLGKTGLGLSIPSNQPYSFFHLKAIGDIGPSESLEIVAVKAIDPYELVVKNQVFKDRQGQIFESLQTQEWVNYRYQGPSGASIDVTFEDTVFYRKGAPTTRVRKNLYIGNVKWPYKDLPELPLIQPEKIQSEPLVIDLDKSYRYAYQGEDKVDGHPTWKVRFVPKEPGDFLSGTVWIDQDTGAHRKLRAQQSGLEPPVSGHEKTAFFDWIEYEGRRYWVETHEDGLLIVNVLGEAIAFQVNIERRDFVFNHADMQSNLDTALSSDQMMLQDTAEGYKYLVKRNGKREVSNEDFVSKKLLLGGVQLDPSLDFPIPLGGFNYSDLDFRDKGYQVNLFVAGALNIGHLSNTNFMDKGWDLTAEIFTTALYFSDTIYEGDEKRDDLEVESIRQAFNITLGIPLNTFTKFSANYSLRYLDYKQADDTDPEFVIPSSTFENIARLNLSYDRHGFSSALEYEGVVRSDWESWGLPDSAEPVEDEYHSIQLDLAVNKKLPKFQNVTVDARYLKGWNLDRFSRFGFGFFENTVAGYGTSGVDGDEAVRLRLGYDIGVKNLFQINTTLDGARAWRDTSASEPVDIFGFGTAVNFIGPWKTLVRINLGYGFHSTLEGEEGDVSGQILFLRLF